MCVLGDRSAGTVLPDAVLERAREQLDEMVSALTAEQKLQIDKLVISAWIPGWLYAAHGIGRPLETDEREREALLTGLNALI